MVQQPCRVCEQPTTSKYGICRRTSSCRKARSEAARPQRLTEYFVDAIDRAGPELAAKVDGQSPAEVERIVRQHFCEIREELIRQSGLKEGF